MSSLSPALQQAVAASSESDSLSSHLSTLLSTSPPPFIFLHNPQNSRIAAHIVRSTLESLPDHLDDATLFSWACVNAVACFSPRILYDTALNALAGWTPEWNDGVRNWDPSSHADGRRYNDNFDAFVHGIQAVAAQHLHSHPSHTGKGKAVAGTSSHKILVLVVERAERLKDNLPDLIVPLTRLAELSHVPITTLFISDVQWQDIRPTLRASPEPYYIDVPALSKQATYELLSSTFPPPPSDISPSISRIAHPDAYHIAFEPFYSDYVATLYSICSPFTKDPLELAYIAAARWPGFVQPVLDAHKRHNEQHRGQTELAPPGGDARLRLMRLFTPSLTAAMEALYPRLSSAEHWARIHAPPSSLLELPPGEAADALIAQVAVNAQTMHVTNSVSDPGLNSLPRMARFVLIAAFLASTNPARSDLRMFGRGLDERSKRRRRKLGTPRKPKPGTTAPALKIPQRLLGPTTFPLDRLLAILGVLLEENDAGVRPVASQYTLPGEYTEMEIARTAVYASIMELASMRLLVRASPTDRLDATPTFKCGIGYELATKLARGVGIVLNDLLYEVV